MTVLETASSRFARSGGAQILFEEDFDHPAPVVKHVVPPEPEVIEPVFTAAELKAAREEAWREADELARTELSSVYDNAVQASLAAIAGQLAEAKEEARTIAEAAAESIAQLLMAGFASAFPSLCRRLGEAELQAIIQQIIPALDHEPKVTIRTAPGSVAGVKRELTRLDVDMAAEVQVLAVETMLPGDIRIHWRAGQAVRDNSRLWQEIEAALLPAGLLPSPGMMQQKLRDTIDVE